MRNLALLISLNVVILLNACAQSSEKAAKILTANPSDIFNGQKIVKTDAEWKKILSPQQYYITRQKGTERAFTSDLNKVKDKGTFSCAACSLPLFTSVTKFESGTGWPSFWAPISPKNVAEEDDNTFGMTRTEVMCSRCGAHLGHVFHDGPQPTGLRYCMNGVALKFAKN